MEDRGQGQLVAVADTTHLGDPVGGPLHGESMEPEAVGSEGESPVAIEDVVGGSRAQNRLNRAWAESLDAVCDAGDPPAALKLTGGTNHGAGEADVSLNDCGDLVRRGASVYQLEGLLTAFLQCGLALRLVESGCQDAPAAFASDARLGTPR
jgi:hypothetical protein